MSQKLWGIHWAQHLPFENAGFLVRLSDYTRAQAFIAANYATVFEEEANASPFATDISAAKSRYYQLFGDFFEFFYGEELAGLLVCTPTDWSTYYIRSAALIPKYQGRRIVQQFYAEALFPVLKAAGVERVEFDTSPANLAMMHIAARLRFNNTGTILSERWGAMVHFTKFLSQHKEDVFLEQFCAGVKYQLRQRGQS
jgi:RimJ/RimL family protein N-acetyltransferase